MKTVTINNQEIFVNSFNELTDSQAQDLASKLVKNEVYSCETTIVEYILSKGFEDTDAPFSYDDLNLDGELEVEIRGNWVTVYESEKEEYIESLEESIEILESRKVSLECYLDCLSHVRSIERVQVLIERLEIRIESLQESIRDLENGYFEQPDIYEWWSVSERLASKLDCVIPHHNYWGRQCMGQSIYLDYNIQKLAFELYSIECWKGGLKTDKAFNLVSTAIKELTSSKTSNSLNELVGSYPQIDKIALDSESILRFIQVANNIYKSNQDYRLKKVRGVWSLDVVSMKGEFVCTVYKGGNLGTTSKSLFYKALMDYLN